MLRRNSMQGADMFKGGAVFFFKYLLSLILCVVLFASIAADFVRADDLSDQYRQLLQKQNILNPDDIQILQRHHIVIVRGFLDEFKREKSFQDQMALFEKNNISYSIAPVESDLSEDENEQVLYSYLLDIQDTVKNPLIVISHSRGGNIVLSTLLMHEDLHSLVRGWLSLQAPFEGATAADKILKSKLGSFFAKVYLKALGVGLDIIKGFTHIFRDSFMFKNSDKITRLLKSVPVLTYGTEIKRLRPINPNFYLHPTRGLFFIQGTDGLVDYASTFLTDRNGLSADSISEFGVDHLGLVHKRNSTREQRIRKTEALLSVLLRKFVSP